MKLIAIVLVLAVPARAATSTFQALGKGFKAPVVVAQGFDAQVIFSNLTAPRGIAFDANQNLLVVERGFGITAFTRVSSPSAGWRRTVVIENPKLTQGIQVDGRNLYVSSGDSILVYEYDIATTSVDATHPPYTFVGGLPANGPVNTHTLQLETDLTGRTVAVLVAVGPSVNIDPLARDPNSGRSTIRRFPIPLREAPLYDPVPFDFSEGQVLAYGLRNPTGFTFHSGWNTFTAGTKNLFVVDNGPELDNVPGLDAAFLSENPADELQQIQYTVGPDSEIPSPQFYGFPDCFTIWNPAADELGVRQYLGTKKGAQFSAQLTPERDDAWCRNKKNNVAPVLPFQAHTSPLDIKFFTPSLFNSNSSFPATYGGDAFVSFHGSLGQPLPSGYGVVRVPFIHGLTPPNVDYSFVIQAMNLTTCPGDCIRPVGLAFGEDGKLYVSSDNSGELFVLQRKIAT
ncbi:L-sorbosone dehydrogenase [Hypsizygus marmoreus]|uniref:L-sorbosone dehydrogenase n=1 Tax=Hypsizygus marmoreus TaxID=39966 RepID=A0A369JDR0_HYPMA|nr:L-sorbosone dehydrogenase [Hypsizygus marmoreus]